MKILPYDLDEDLIAAAESTGREQLRIIQYPQVAAVIGRGGKIEVEVHADRLAADGIPLLRRRGGGCAVVLDPGNLIVSLVLPRPGVGEITRTFRELSERMIAALTACGVPGVRQEGTSDLALGDRKLGGSCIYRSRGLIYYSTTLLVDPDLELIDRYLPHPPREPDYRRARSHHDFLTSLARESRPAAAPGDSVALADCLRRHLTGSTAGG